MSASLLPLLQSKVSAEVGEEGFERGVAKRAASACHGGVVIGQIVTADHCLSVECAVIDGEATPFVRDKHLCQLASVLAHLPHRCEHVFQVGRFIAPWRFGSCFS